VGPRCKPVPSRGRQRRTRSRRVVVGEQWRALAAPFEEARDAAYGVGCEPSPVPSSSAFEYGYPVPIIVLAGQALGRTFPGIEGR
jgi:hypothetical protein